MNGTPASRGCLDVENGSTANGGRVVQKTCSSAVNSQRFTWFATSGTNEALSFTFKHSNKCLLVVFFSEVSIGVDHNIQNMPLSIFGDAAFSSGPIANLFA
jgi:hypothetical protein